MKLLPVARGSETIGICGKRNCGKTMLGSFLIAGKVAQGSIAFSNIPLNFSFIRIRSIKDIEQIYTYDDKHPNSEKVLFLDDVDRILHARNYQFNKELNDILMDFGKISCSLVFTSKMGPLSEGKFVDVALRDATDLWYMPEIVLKYRHPNPKFTTWMDGFMDFKKMNIMYVDGGLSDCGMLNPIMNLLPLCSLYQTKEKVSPLIITEK